MDIADIDIFYKSISGRCQEYKKPRVRYIGKVAAIDKDTEIKELKQRMRLTLNELCTCSDKGITRWSMCPACRFKHSFD